MLDQNTINIIKSTVPVLEQHGETMTVSVTLLSIAKSLRVMSSLPSI